MRRAVSSASAILLLVALLAGGVPIARAGTTGGITGRITDPSGAAVGNATVTVSSPSQAQATTSDDAGTYRFLSLAPDTYTIRLRKDGYDPVVQPGLTVVADQVQSFNFSMQRIKEIAHVQSRAGTSLLKPGATSDVYSVNAAGAEAAQSLVGPGGLNSAYGAIASVPGVAIDPGEQGWFQTVHIRGGDIDQVGYELDGIPVNRVYDNAPQTMLSTLGQQELQVYTGGTPATADAQGIAGYINQVVKTGTYPGFGTAVIGVGGPAFYHHASFEVGGSTPNRLFSYYFGVSGADQDYRYIDNSNGSGSPLSFFYPVNATPGINGFVYDGTSSPPATAFTTGSAYGIANSSQRDTVANVHIGIPHKRDGLRDDVQLLYLTSEVGAQYYSSTNDLGATIVQALNGGPLTWDDAFLYTGAFLQPVNPAALIPYYYPSSPTQREFGSNLPYSQRDTNDNGVAIVKAQYQHTFSPSAFLRVYGYQLYSNWFIYGPNSAAQPLYGAELADYEIPNHTYGVNATLTDQLSARHLLTASAVYTGSNLQRFSAGFFSGGTSRPVSLPVDAAGNCYDYTTGNQVGCYYAISNGLVGSGNNLIPGPAPAGSQWVAIDRGLKANLNQVRPRFSGLSLTDQWRPNDRLTINAGARFENFQFLLGNTRPDDPSRQFLFAHYNAEYCFGAGLTAPVLRSNSGLGTCPTGTSAVNLVNKSGGSISSSRFQPRFGFTYEVNPETVVRGSFGVYARPQNTSWVQYDTFQQDLPSFIGSHFYSFGFNSPEHDIRPDTSYNADLSLEKRFRDSDVSFKVTPFYRSTRDQLQNFFIDPLTGLESGLNVGHQVSYGLELALQKGDPTRDGLSGQLAYTYTHSRIQYKNFDNSGVNVIDGLNLQIARYNAFTAGGGGAKCYTPEVAGTPGVPDNTCAVGNIPNPYYGQPVQPLLDRNGQYTTYDVIPGPFSAANGYETPHVASLILNYKRGRFAITPSFAYNSGASYGSPLVWPGYIPQSCGATMAGGKADPITCSDDGNLPLFLPDPYTGKFDNLGSLKQPWRLSANLALTYEMSSRFRAHLTLTNLVDHCGQRGYAWDDPNVCVYSALPSGILAPGGNFFPNSAVASTPAQLKYPYTFWLNNNNTGFVGVKLPFQATFTLDIRL